jgi:hypothetical protein
VLGALILAALLAFFCIRRRRRAGAVEERNDPDYRTSPYMQEVDAGSIHSSSSSRHLRALPPSYNPQWSTRVRPDAMPGAGSSSDGLTPSPPPLSPGFAGPTSGFFKLPHVQPPPAKASPAALADYKHPYVTGTFERLGPGQPRVEGEAGPPPEASPSQPVQPALENDVPLISPPKTRRPLPTPPTAPAG